ncbi:MAG: hypothetical protein V1492_06490 [Candidatus Micrarchaeota archaeon]
MRQKKVVRAQENVQGKNEIKTVGDKVLEKLKQDEYLATITEGKLKRITWSELLTLALKLRKMIESGNTSQELRKKDELVRRVIYDRSRQQPD